MSNHRRIPGSIARATGVVRAFATRVSIRLCHHRHLRAIAYVALTLLAAVSVAQRRSPYATERSLFSDYGSSVISIEALALPARDSAWRIDVNINYANAMLIFTGTEKNKRAVPEMFCEVKRTSDGYTIARASHIDTLHTDVPLSKTLSQHATFSFPVAVSGVYTVNVDFSGPSIKYNGSEQRRFVVIPETKKDSVAIAGITICYPPSVDVYKRVPLGGNFPFGVDAVCLVPLKENVDSVQWELKKIKSEDETQSYKRGSSSDVISGTLEQHATSYTVVSRSNYFTARLPFTKTMLEQGNYRFTLKAFAGARRGTFTKNIAVLWGDMPMSLSNLEFAIEALSYIATPEEKDYLTSGSEVEMQKKFEDFWKKRDPSAGTPFNEYMEEYYKRVDYAYFNFETIAEENGVKTDRGKVYILFGTPTETRRIFSPSGAPEEIWTYKNNVARKFTFTDKSRDGSYRLVSEEKI